MFRMSPVTFLLHGSKMPSLHCFIEKCSLYVKIVFNLIKEFFTLAPILNRVFFILSFKLFSYPTIGPDCQVKRLKENS